MKNQELLDIEKRCIVRARIAINNIHHKASYKAKAPKEQSMLISLAIASALGMEILEIPVGSVSSLEAYTQTVAPIVETALSCINEEYPINIELTESLTRQVWMTRFNITKGHMPKEMIDAIIRNSSFIPGNIRSLV